MRMRGAPKTPHHAPRIRRYDKISTGVIPAIEVVTDAGSRNGGGCSKGSCKCGSWKPLDLWSLCFETSSFELSGIAIDVLVSTESTLSLLFVLLFFSFGLRHLPMWFTGYPVTSQSQLARLESQHSSTLYHRTYSPRQKEYPSLKPPGILTYG